MAHLEYQCVLSPTGKRIWYHRGMRVPAKNVPRGVKNIPCTERQRYRAGSYLEVLPRELREEISALREDVEFKTHRWTGQDGTLRIDITNIKITTCGTEILTHNFGFFYDALVAFVKGIQTTGEYNDISANYGSFSWLSDRLYLSGDATINLSPDLSQVFLTKLSRTLR